MRHRIVAAIGVTVMATIGATLAAEQRGGNVTLTPPPPSGVSAGVKFSAPYRPEGAGTRVVGTVIDIRQVPVAKVKVRLRNTTTGEVLSETVSDQNGAYSFPEVEPGNYVVEMFIENRYVVALSNNGAVSRDQTWTSVIQLPGRWETVTQTVVNENRAVNFVGVSASTSMTAATMTQAVTQEIRAIDTGVMVSPR